MKIRKGLVTLFDSTCMHLERHVTMTSKFITQFVYRNLKIQSCKLYNSKYIIASTQITNTEDFALIALVVLMLLSRKALFINRKDNRNC